MRTYVYFNLHSLSYIYDEDNIEIASVASYRVDS